MEGDRNTVAFNNITSLPDIRWPDTENLAFVGSALSSFACPSALILCFSLFGCTFPSLFPVLDIL